MWHLMKKGKGLLFFCFFAETSFSQSLQTYDLAQSGSSASSYNQSVVKEVQPRLDNWTFQPRIGIGFGRFQNVVLPVDQNADPTAEERANDLTAQNGVPLFLGIGSTHKFDTFRTTTDFDFLHMSTLLGASPGQKSTPSFSRMELGQTVAAAFNENLWSLFSGVAYRRDAFKDGSFAHVVDSGLVKVGAGLNLFSTQLNAAYGHSLYNRFGFTNKSSLAVRKTKGSKASMHYYSLDASRALGPTTDINISFEAEQIQLSYPLHGAYESFGLASEEDVASVRALNLNTDIFSVRIIKYF